MALPPDRQLSALSSDSRKRIRSRLLLLAKLLFAGFVLWLLYRLQLLSFAPLVALLNSPWLVATAALLVWLSHPLVALRWQLLLRTQQIDLAYFDVFKLNYAAAFLGTYLPGMVGGDIARVALGFSLSRIQVSALALSVAADRMTGLLGLLIVGTVASSVYLVLLDARLPQYVEMRTLLMSLGVIFAVGIIAVAALVAVARRVRRYGLRHAWPDKGALLRFTIQTLEVGRQYSRDLRRLILAVTLSVLIHTLGLAALTLLAWGTNLGGLSLWKFSVAGAVAAIVNAIPLTPGGLGIGEITFAQLVLWLEPASIALPYATVFLAYRAIVVLTLVPALFTLPSRIRDHP